MIKKDKQKVLAGKYFFQLLKEVASKRPIPQNSNEKKV